MYTCKPIYLKEELRMINVIKKYAPLGIVSLLLLVIGQIVESILSTMATSSISELFGQLGSGSIAINSVLIYMGLTIGDTVVNRAVTYYSAHVRESMSTSLRCDYFNKLLELPVPCLQDISIGDITTSGTTIPDMVNNVVWLPQMVLSTIASFIAALVVFAKADWKLTLISLALVIIFGIPFLIINVKIRPMAKEKRELEGQISDQYQRIRCYSVIKGFTKQSFESKSFYDTQKKFESVSMRKRLLNIKMSNIP